jgi:hypothetical protein
MRDELDDNEFISGSSQKMLESGEFPELLSRTNKDDLH